MAVGRLLEPISPRSSSDNIVQFRPPARPKNGFWQHYFFNDPREFDRWLKANAVLGSLLAVGILAMALVGLYAPAELLDVATDLSSVSLSHLAAPTAPVISPQLIISPAPQAEPDAAEERQNEQDINSGIKYPDERPSASLP